MAAGWPVKANYATGDILSATNMNDLSGTVNYINPTSATDGQVLTRDNASAGKVKWATAGGGGKVYSLLSTTTMTGAATITVSSLTSDEYYIFFDQVSAGASSVFSMRVNTSSAAEYNYYGTLATIETAYNAGNLFNPQQFPNETSFNIGGLSSSATSWWSGAITLGSGKQAGGKPYSVIGSSHNAGGVNKVIASYGGMWANNATVTSISFLSSVGNFDAGTVQIWGAA